jgi:excisionase family DNA binding protein
MTDHATHWQHRRYQLTCEQFDELLVRAGGRCERCGREVAPLVIDHRHDLGSTARAVRGLVCRSCNRRLIAVDAGSVPDDETARYLRISGVPFPPLAPRFLTAREAAERLSVSVRTLTRWIDAGVLTVHRTPGGHRRFDPAEIDALRAPEPTPMPRTD